LQFGHTGTGNGILAQVPLTEAALNGLKSGSKGSRFVTTRAIAIAGALACVMLCDSVAIAADGGAAVHAPPAEAAVSFACRPAAASPRLPVPSRASLQNLRPHCGRGIRGGQGRCSLI